MPGSLEHSPADVLRWLLVDLSLGSDPAGWDTGTGEEWPMFVGTEPQKPDNCVTLQDTEGRDMGRIQISGERQDLQGVQVRVRGVTENTAFLKADAIKAALDGSCFRKHVVLTGATYLVNGVNRTGNPVNVGRQNPSTKRGIFTVNCLVSLRQIA